MRKGNTLQGIHSVYDRGHANFLEPPKGEVVRRISIPRTPRVNKASERDQPTKVPSPIHREFIVVCSHKSRWAGRREGSAS